MARSSYIYRIIARLAYLHVTGRDVSNPATTESLFEWLSGGRAYGDKVDQSRYMPSDERGLEAALRDLDRLGVVRGDAPPTSHKNDDGDRTVYWRFSGAVPPNIELAVEDGGDHGDDEGGGPPAIADTPGGGGDDEGGAGLGQVLAHPVLFSLNESEWTAVVESAFSNLPDGPETEGSA